MEVLKPYRKKIDALDDQIIDLLAQRLEVIHDVCVIKEKHGIAPVIKERVDEVRDRCIARGVQKGYSEDFMHALYTQIIEYSCAVEQAYIDHKKSKDHG